MSIWSDIQDRSAGEITRKEDRPRTIDELWEDILYGSVILDSSQNIKMEINLFDDMLDNMVKGKDVLPGFPKLEDIINNI